jgi:HD superfamily phosphohydrolase
MRTRGIAFRDTLYGRVRLDDDISELSLTPMVQRLRHVRLSNIDSIDMPGIANLSRYEHVLGVAHLASEVGFRSKLSTFERLIVQASALLHDWAITAFGHLVEEALQYVGTGFDHAKRLREIASDETPEEIGGLNRQILAGRETGLAKWARKVTSSHTEAEELIDGIAQHIRGQGRFGRVISGDIDLDNIDNVFRMAYHMGLNPDVEAPIRLARSIVGCDGRSGEPIFQREARSDIDLWRTSRSAIYEHLMLAERDFAGKCMILFATIRAYEENEIRNVDWSLTDYQLLNLLLTSKTSDAKEAVSRWITGELWKFAPLQWMNGDRPDYQLMRSFSRELTPRLGRTCFAYAIKDKRNRALAIHFDDGSVQRMGESPRQWLLGVGSPKREAFTAADVRVIFELACAYFKTGIIGLAAGAPHVRETEPTLL